MVVCGNIILVEIGLMCKMSIKCRYFNELQICNGIVEKISADDSLFEESLYYKNLSPRFEKYFVNFIELIANKTNYKLVLDYYPSFRLSDLYINNKKTLPFWSDMFDNILHVIDDFSKESIESNIDDMMYMFKDKLVYRLETYMESDSFRQFFNFNALVINGKVYPNIDKIILLIYDYINNILVDCKEFNYIHGDMCFSNILISESNDHEFKFVDPRGKFGSTLGNFGDTRYDIAKLSHSVFGLYDFILQNRYNLRYNSINNIDIEFNLDKEIESIQYLFKEKFQSLLSYTDMRVLESTLFLSMLPLHKEDVFRQCGLFVNGIKILSDVGVI